MYVKNLDQTTAADLEFLSLRRSGRYWFPHWVKYIAWSLVILAIGISSFILIYYGMSFGMMKTYLWLTGIILTFILGLVLFTPARICIFVFLDSIFFKLKPIIVRRKIYHSLLSNPENPERKKRVEEFRKYNQHLYKPLHYRQLQPRLDDIKYHIEMRNLTIEVLAHFVFIFLLIYVVLFSVTSYGYNVSIVIQNLVVKANYTQTIPFTYITTTNTFIEYLNLSLLPALLQNYDVFYNLPGNEGRNDSNIYERGWTMDPAVKLIGVPRLRQIRATSDHCLEHIDLKGRNPRCAEELDFYNQETRDFTLGWAAGPAQGLTENQAQPWIYQSGWDSVSCGVVGKYFNYPGGGYILTLARNIDDSRIILDFMKEFNWIDIKTRAVFIEFTTYCVNINTFNVVTLIAEKSGTGYFVTSSVIQPCKFTFNLGELEMIYLIMTICFALLLFIFLCREGLRIRRTSFKEYVRRPLVLMDLVVVVLGVTIIIFMVLQSFYVKRLIAQLEDANNNKFVSFAFAAYWSRVGITLEAIVIVLSGFKLFRLLTYRVLFFQLQTTLGHSWKNFFNLVLKTFVIIIAFTMFFHLSLLTSAHNFSSWPVSISTVIGLTVALDNDFNFKIFSERNWYVSTMYYVLFVIFIPLLLMNLYIAIVCLYFHEIKKVNLINKYSLIKYIKYLLTRNANSDVFILAYDKHLKSHKNEKTQESIEIPSEGGPMRLRGGGNKKSKQEKILKENKKIEKEKNRKEYKLEKENRKRQEELDEIMLETIYLKDFVKKKPYDVTRYIALPLERILAMKYITIDYLSSNKEEKVRSREIAIKAWYLYAGFPSTEFDNDRFLIVIIGPEEFPMQEHIFWPLKHTTEQIGLKKHWIIEDVIDDIEFKSLKNDLQYLDNALSTIIENSKKTCKKKKKKKIL